MANEFKYGISRARLTETVLAEPWLPPRRGDVNGTQVPAAQDWLQKRGKKKINPICGMLINFAESLMSLTLNEGQRGLIRAPLASLWHL